MLCCKSAAFTTFTPLSVRFTTSGCSGITGVVACCAKRIVGTKRSVGTRRIAATIAAAALRLPPPASLLPLQPFQQRVVARGRRDALDKPFHRGTGRHLL